MLKMDGLDEACIGLVELPDGKHLVYSVSAILMVLETRDGMDEEEAKEFYEFNILRGVEYMVNDPERPVLVQDRECHESLDDFADRMEVANG